MWMHRLGESLPPFPASTHGIPNSPFVTIAQAINSIPTDALDHDPDREIAHPNHPMAEQSMDRPLLNTITTKRAGLWHPTAGRRFTVRETASLQGFPLNHQFAGADGDKLRQIGTAVPPPMARAILQEVRMSLLQTDGLIQDRDDGSDIDEGMGDIDDELGDVDEGLWRMLIR